jgi:hypothetical protein
MKHKTDEQKLAEAEFFAKKYYLSYSALSKLLSSPTVFYNDYVLNQKEDIKGVYLDLGKAIHCLLLDREQFDNQFIVASSNIPTGNTQAVVDRIFAIHKELTIGTDEFNSRDLGNYGDEILEYLKEINLHQSLKTDPQRIDKIISTQSIEYFDYLKVAENKTIIDNDTFEQCLVAVEAIKENQSVSNLLGLEQINPEVIIFNEYPLQAEPTVHPFGYKGILDNLRIVRSEKTIYINDVKRTGKSLVYFEESVEKYNYWAQAAMYIKLVKANIQEANDVDWKIVFNFIVVDSYNQVYPFEVSTETLDKWTLNLDNKLKEVDYHFKSNDFTLPYKFATGKVTL